MLRDKCNIDSLNLSRIPDFSSQYFQTYCIRLNCLSNMLKQNIVDKWGTNVNLIKLCNVVSDQPCVLIGTLCKEMQHRPSVIKELSEWQELGGTVKVAKPKKLISSTDSLYLEDTEQRILLNADKKISAGSVVTGVVVAVCGHEPIDAKGTFVVEDIVFATPRFQLLKTLNNNAMITHCRYVALISGLYLNHRRAEHNSNWLLSMKMFFDWISGAVPIETIPINSREVGRLIFAGDSFGPVTESAIDTNTINPDNSIPTTEETVAAANCFDELLEAVCQSIPIDIMSGPSDPCSIVIPQKPLHRVLFPRARKWASFNTRPNPWLFNFDNGDLVIGTSGQMIDDIERYSDIDDALDRLEATVKWGHLAPTAPDTLDSFPNVGLTDPLVMPHKPTLYFAGNQDRMAWRNLTDSNGRSSLLVTVPRFKDSAEVVIVDLVERNCQSLSFKEILLQ